MSSKNKKSDFTFNNFIPYLIFGAIGGIGIYTVLYGFGYPNSLALKASSSSGHGSSSGGSGAGSGGSGSGGSGGSSGGHSSGHSSSSGHGKGHSAATAAGGKGRAHTSHPAHTHSNVTAHHHAPITAHSPVHNLTHPAQTHHNQQSVHNARTHTPNNNFTHDNVSKRAPIVMSEQSMHNQVVSNPLGVNISTLSHFNSMVGPGLHNPRVQDAGYAPVTGPQGQLMGWSGPPAPPGFHETSGPLNLPEGDPRLIVYGGKRDQ